MLIAGIALHSVGASARGQRASWPADESYVNLPSTSAARWSYLGYNEVGADLTWIRLLVYYGSGFIGEGDFRYLNNFVSNVIVLDPRFKKVYEWASYTVTVTEEHRISTDEEDVLQSIEILEGAMREFPDEYEFFWLTGIRYFIDLKSDDPETQRSYKEKGAHYLELAMQKPNAPKDLAMKAAAFRTQLGQFEQARQSLALMIMTTDDANARERMLASFKNIAPAGMAEELAMAVEQFHTLHIEHQPGLSDHLFILLGGPPPDALIDFALLATERSLFGADEIRGIKLFE